MKSNDVVSFGHGCFVAFLSVFLFLFVFAGRDCMGSTAEPSQPLEHQLTRTERMKQFLVDIKDYVKGSGKRFKNGVSNVWGTYFSPYIQKIDPRILTLRYCFWLLKHGRGYKYALKVAKYYINSNNVKVQELAKDLIQNLELEKIKKVESIQKFGNKQILISIQYSCPEEFINFFLSKFQHVINASLQKNDLVLISGLIDNEPKLIMQSLKNIFNPLFVSAFGIIIPIFTSEFEYIIPTTLMILTFKIFNNALPFIIKGEEQNKGELNKLEYYYYMFLTCVFIATKFLSECSTLKVKDLEFVSDQFYDVAKNKSIIISYERIILNALGFKIDLTDDEIRSEITEFVKTLPLDKLEILATECTSMAD